MPSHVSLLFAIIFYPPISAKRRSTKLKVLECCTFQLRSEVKPWPTLQSNTANSQTRNRIYFLIFVSRIFVRVRAIEDHVDRSFVDVLTEEERSRDLRAWHRLGPSPSGPVFFSEAADSQRWTRLTVSGVVLATPVTTAWPCGVVVVVVVVVVQ